MYYYYNRNLKQTNHLPQKRKAPARYEEGSGLGYNPTAPKEFYHHQYFECLDICVSCTKERFNQPGHMVLKNVEDLLLKAANDDYTPELECFSRLT